jgi:ABC-type Na+ efflux pump permease subunit
VAAFVRLLRLDLTLQRRSFLYPATAVSTGMICAFVLLLPGREVSARLTAFFVFMDPATIGLGFVGAMVLAEKAQGTLAALGVTPVRPAAWVGAKAVSLTLLTSASSLVVVQVATRGGAGLVRPLAAVALTSAAAVLLGLWSVARAPSMNRLVVTLLWVTSLLYLPLLAHFGILEGPEALAVAWIPSHAMLALLRVSVDPTAAVTAGQLGAAIYLALWVWMGWRWTLREFERTIATEGR